MANKIKIIFAKIRKSNRSILYLKIIMETTIMTKKETE